MNLKKTVLVFICIFTLCIITGCADYYECVNHFDTDNNGYCNNCNTNVCSHNWVEATCTSPKTCTICKITEGEKLEHIEGDVVIEDMIEATCTTGGEYYEIKYCTVCNETLFKLKVIINELGHKVVVDEKIDPTCKQEGLTEGSHCSLCNEVFVAQEKIEVLEHVFSEEYTIDKEATYLEAGEKSRHCINCEERIDIEKIPIIPIYSSLEQITNDFLTDVALHKGVTLEVVKENFTTNKIWHSYWAWGTFFATNANNGKNPEYPSAGEPAFWNVPENREKWLWLIEEIYIAMLMYPGGTQYSASLKHVQNAIENNFSESPETINKAVWYFLNGSMSTFFGFNFNNMGDSDNVPETNETIVIPEGTTEIKAIEYAKLNNIITVTIPNSVTNIGEWAFYGCSSLEGVYYNGTIEDWCNITFDTAYSNPMHYAEHFYMLDENNEYYEVTEIVIPNTVTTIGNYQFYGFDNLTIIELSNGIESIGTAAFKDCNNLTDIEIPNSVTSIGISAFANCNNLVNIEIPNSVTSIGISAFENCSNLTNIEISSNIISIGEGVFVGCTNLKYKEYGNALYLGNKENPYLVLIKAKDTNITSCTIHENTKLISLSAFSKCSNLESIEIPSNITNFNNISLNDCINLKYNEYDNALYLGNEENPYLVLIKAKDKNITSCIIHESTKIIYDNAFSGCSNLETIEIPDGVTNIGNAAFYGCTSLKTVGIPDSVTYLGTGVFYNCSSLESIIIPDGVTHIYASLFYECLNLKNVVLPNNIISIGATAFYGCINLESINLPDSVESIGDLAFFGCTSLENIVLPSSLVNIGYSAFYGCSSLKNVTISDSITSIEREVFNNCINLENVYYNGTIEDWFNITLVSNSSNPMYYAKHFYMLDENNEYYEVTEIVIPDIVTTLDNYHTRGFENLINIVIPGSITSIEDSAFYGCSSLEGVYYKGTIEDWCNIEFNYNSSYLMNYAEHFYMLDENNEYYEVTKIVIPNTITTIGNYQFYGFDNLTSIEIPNSITSIGDYAFYGCSSLEGVYYKGTIEDWCNITFKGSVSNPMYYAEHFYMLDENNEYYEVTKIVIPNTITTIGNYQFYGFDNLTIYCEVESQPSGWSNNWNNSRPVYWGINETNYLEQDGIIYVIKNDKAVVTRYTGIKENVIIPSVVELNLKEYTVASIGEYSFAECINLTSIEIPNSVTSIGDYAFSGCSNLTIYCEVESQPSGWSNNWNNSRPVYWGINETNYLEQDGIIYVIKNDKAVVTRYTGIKENVIIPSVVELNLKEYTVASIGEYSFAECINLTSIEIPNSVTNIGSYAFYNCSSLTSILVDTENPVYDSRNNCNAIIETSTNTLIVGCKNTIIPNGITSIGTSAFRGCSNLTSIQIPNSVTSIGNYAFSGCSNLTSIEIPNSVTSIGSFAFSGCSSLESVYYTGTIEDWCNITFKIYVSNPMNYAEHFYMLDENNEYYEVTEIVVPNTITTIGKYQFYGFDNLTNIELSNGIESIEKAAFEDCSSLTSIEIPNSVTSIGSGAFENCSSLTSIEILNSVTSIGSGAFYRCEKLTNVIIGNGVTSIGDLAFGFCTSLTSIEIPNSVTSIGSDAFYGCSSLTIYCEVESQPSGWSSSWNSSNRPVYYAGEWTYDSDGNPVPIG